MDYEDLVIQFGPGAAGGYTVRVARSLAGETDPEPLIVPISEDEIDHLAAAVGLAARDLQTTTASAIPAATVAVLGDRLYRALLPEAVRNRYHESLGHIALRGDRGLRLRVQMGLGIPAMAQLHAIPWEYLHAPEAGAFLALSRKTSVVRYLDLEIPGDRPTVPPPLTILAVACEDPALDLAGERRAIEEAWSGQGKVHLKLLRNATLGSLREELLARDYHVVHFMGHGGFDPAAGEGSLAFRDNAGCRVWITGPQLAEHLRDVSALRLVVLNACWTARTSSTAPYAGVATAILKAGIPAVLAMQFSISDAAALVFSRSFYRTLACGDTIDAAVTEGRLAIRRGNRTSVEWGTPVLFERLTGGRVLDRPAKLSRRALLAVLACGFSLAAMIGICTASLKGLSTSICNVPSIRAVCTSWKLAGLPSKSEEALWSKRAPGDCTGLRSYLERFPQGVHAEEAERRLQAARTVEIERWVPQEQRLPLTVRATLTPLANEQAARADALTRATAEADRACEGLKIGGLRIKLATMESQSWRCLPRGSGAACGFDGQVICHFEARRATQHQVCR
jgi:CHAT domain